jgi:hypothetical protein
MAILSRAGRLEQAAGAKRSESPENQKRDDGAEGSRGKSILRVAGRTGRDPRSLLRGPMNVGGLTFGPGHATVDWVFSRLVCEGLPS